jgi:hypothetical protein
MINIFKKKLIRYNYCQHINISMYFKKCLNSFISNARYKIFNLYVCSYFKKYRQYKIYIK